MKIVVAGMECEGASTDTRTLAAGQAFVALAGEHHDGHDYVAEAFSKGAAAAVVSRPVDAPGAQEVTRDTLVWLQEEARRQRARWGRAVVGVTGSAGKTTTKDAISAALGRRFRAGKTQGNFNNHIGVPLSILNMPETAEIGVLEVGMNHAGEIRHLASIARPQVAVVVNVGSAHIENFDSIEGIAQAKRELVESLEADGVAVLNWDDARVRGFAGAHGGRTVSYGMGEGAEVRAVNIEWTARGSRFAVDGVEVACPLAARGGLMAALAALAVARVFGIEVREAREGLEQMTAPKMRLERLECRGATIWNDSYNSNPEAAMMMLDLLGGTPARRRIALLGEMLELGRWSKDLHREVGQYAVRCGTDVLVGIRGAARHLVDAALEAGLPAGAAHFFDEPGPAGEWLKGEAREGDAVLVKGSRGTRMEKALEAFLKD